MFTFHRDDDTWKPVSDYVERRGDVWDEESGTISVPREGAGPQLSVLFRTCVQACAVIDTWN